MATGILGQLQQLAGPLRASQFILGFIAVGFVLLSVDYTRVLLLRRKMVLIRSLLDRSL
jgi:hypothetical protein